MLYITLLTFKVYPLRKAVAHPTLQKFIDIRLRLNIYSEYSTHSTDLYSDNSTHCHYYWLFIWHKYFRMNRAKVVWEFVKT